MQARKITKSDVDEIKKYLTYDPNNGNFYWKNKSGGEPAGYVLERISNQGKPYRTVVIKVRGRKLQAARLAWAMTHGDVSDEYVIDHIDKNGTNNRISNLRLATFSENSLNISLPKHNKSGIIGVAVLRTGKFVVHIGKNNKNIRLGVFDSKLEAACHRLAAEQCTGYLLLNADSTAKKFVEEHCCRTPE